MFKPNIFLPIFDKIPWAIYIISPWSFENLWVFERAPVKLWKVIAVQRCYASHVSADIPLICLSLLYTAWQSDSDGDQCGASVPNTSPWPHPLPAYERHSALWDWWHTNWLNSYSILIATINFCVHFVCISFPHDVVSYIIATSNKLMTLYYTHNYIL